MRLNIRSKLVLLQGALIAALVLAGLMVNGVFLEKYYLAENEKLMMDVIEKARWSYMEEEENIADVLYDIDRSEGISILIAGKDKRVKYASSAKKNGQGNVKIPRQIEQILTAHQHQLPGDVIYQVAEKEQTQTPKAVMIARTEQGEYFILTKAMKGIRESAAIANRFYIYVGLFMMLVGTIVTLAFSRAITKPLIDMSKVAQHIAALDFSCRVTTRSQDEIGALGQSINTIADRLSESINGLKQDIARRKQLVRDMSHELKTPIGVIKGYTEGLQFGVADGPEKAAKYCRVIVEECDRMDIMIKELLDLSKLEDATTQPQKKKFSVISLLGNVRERFENAMQSMGILLEINCDKDIELFADYALIERAVGNFMTNAIKHCTQDGIICISACKTSAGSTRLTVYNTGASLSGEELERVWDVFYKSDRARGRERGGHGVGLAIVRSIAEAHGGGIQVQNESGGVSFSIEIPANP